MARKRENIVFGVIGLCVALAALAFMWSRLRDDEWNDIPRTEIVTENEGIDLALEFFLMDVGRYPLTEEGLAALVSAPESIEEKWRGPYLTTIPEGGQTAYRSDGHSYKLTFKGKVFRRNEEDRNQ